MVAASAMIGSGLTPQVRPRGLIIQGIGRRVFEGYPQNYPYPWVVTPP